VKDVDERQSCTVSYSAARFVGPSIERAKQRVVVRLSAVVTIRPSPNGHVEARGSAIYNGAGAFRSMWAFLLDES
jgi:hypothetical protein